VLIDPAANRAAVAVDESCGQASFCLPKLAY
jgi:hypothetical protein